MSVIDPMQRNVKFDVQNNPNKAGENATNKVIFGPCSRYAIAAIHTRFDKIQWFLWDAEVPDIDNENRASIVRQTDSLYAALMDLSGFSIYDHNDVVNVTHKLEII